MAAKEQAVLEVSVTGVDKAASQFTSFQQTTTKTMSASEAAVSRSLKNMVAQFVGVAAVARSVQNVVSSGIGFDRFVEDTTTSFTVMMKSADKAKQQMKDLYDFAVNSPLTFKETASSSKQLMAYGFTAEQLIPTMKTLGSVAIATGHSLDDISYVYGTLKSQGRAYSRDLMQFGMRGIPIYEELAKVMNVNVNQIQKMASEGKIGFAEVERAFQNMTTGSGRFSGVIEGYMTTLTGKLSMLGDIAQQSAGTLMSGVTAQLKILVDSLTKSLSSSGMKLFIQNLANDLTTITSALRALITFVVDNIDIITTALKIWMASKLFNGAIKALNIDFVAVLATVKELAAVFKGLGVGGVATVFSAAINSSNTAIGKLFAQIAAGISLVLSPVGLLVSSIVAVGVALKMQNDEWKKSAISAKSAADDTIRMAQFMKDYSSASEKAYGSLWQYIKNIVGTNKDIGAVDPSAVSKLAEEYNLSTKAVADALIYQGRLTQEAWNTYAAVQATKDAQSSNYVSPQAYVSTKKFSKDFTALGIDMNTYAEAMLKSVGAEDLIGDFRAGVKSAIDTAYKAISTYGVPSADWMEKQILSQLPSMDIVSAMIKRGANQTSIDDATEKVLKDRVAILSNDLQNLLQTAGDTPTKQESKVIDWLVIQLNDAQKQLDGLSNKTGKAATAAKELGKWWAPIVQAAKNSIDPIDDITVSTQQASEAAAKEFNDRQKNYDELIKQAKTEQDAIRYMQLKSSEAALYLQYQKDITAEGEKQKNLKLYETATEGNSAVMDNWKAASGAAYAKGGLSGNIEGAAIQSATQTVSGTQVGAMLTGGNPLAGAASALVDFAKSITNVNAVLNPFTTIFEAMRSTLEPIVNNVLQPLVDILQMVGEALAPIIAVIVASLKPSLSILYLVIAPVVGALQILGAGFTWFYNYVIVPVANSIVNIVNAIIKVLNKIPFVHIKYLDSLDKITSANEDYATMLNNQKSALDQTIDYLTKKIKDSVDAQISSLQDLYEVGAISASDYEKQVESLNAQKIDESTALITAADKQLTSTQDIYARLYELYSLKDIIESNAGLTDTQLSNLLSSYGLSSDSRESVMKSAILAALREYNAATGNQSSTENSYINSAAQTLATNKQKNTKTDYSSAFSGITLSGAYDFAKFMGATYGSQYKSYFDNIIANVAASGYNADGTPKSGKGGTLSEALQSTLASYMDTLEKYGAYINSDAAWEISSGYKQSYAVGTGNVPYDMTAQIHKGEGIVPATFMDSIRSGELALTSGSNEGSGQNVVVNVTVQGSVQTEKDLATSIAQAIYVQRSRGALTV